MNVALKIEKLNIENELSERGRRLLQTLIPSMQHQVLDKRGYRRLTCPMFLTVVGTDKAKLRAEIVRQLNELERTGVWQYGTLGVGMKDLGVAADGVHRYGAYAFVFVHEDYAMEPVWSEGSPGPGAVVRVEADHAKIRQVCPAVFPQHEGHVRSL